MFKKIKWWNIPENKRVKLIPRDIPLENIRMPSTLVHHRSSTIDNDLVNTDVIEKMKEIILYDAVINEKLNENSSIKRDFYEQIVTSTNRFYKVGDFVYVVNMENNNNTVRKQFILRIDKIWKENDSYCISGPVFIQPSDINNREQLIVTSKCFYEREVIKRDGPSTQIALHDIRGKCSVLSVKHFCTHRLTEISESDVYVCESKYVIDDHSLRGLSKPLKRISLSSKATADEIWTFRKELLLKQETPGGLLKLVDEGSTMDVNDSSNHILTGDDHHSNYETSNSGTNLNSSISNRYSNNRKPNRRVSITRPVSGYLVFASESRKRLVRDNPGIPFGDLSRIIGDQWRRLPALEREKFEEKARERAKEQETQLVNNSVVHEPPPRVINGPVTMNGYYPNVPQPMNGILPVLLKAPTIPVVHHPPRIQRAVHSETYSRYIDHLKNDHPFISDWPKQIKASIGNNVNTSLRTLPSHWFMNNSPGFYNNVYEALWSMRDNMWSDVVRVRNVSSEEW